MVGVLARGGPEIFPLYCGDAKHVFANDFMVLDIGKGLGKLEATRLGRDTVLRVPDSCGETSFVFGRKGDYVTLNCKYEIMDAYAFIARYGHLIGENNVNKNTETTKQQVKQTNPSRTKTKQEKIGATSRAVFPTHPAARAPKRILFLRPNI